MDKNLSALIALAVVFSGSFAFNTQSVEAKTARKIASKDKNYFVPPPPPYTPSMMDLANPSAMVMTNEQAVAAKDNQSNKPQAVQANPYLSHDPVVETKIQKHIDSIDSEISNIQKDIRKLLDL